LRNASILEHKSDEYEESSEALLRRRRDELAILPIDVEPPLSPDQAKTVLALSQKHGLTVYDAAYLELAKRKGFSLATMDSALITAAPLEGVTVETQP
jgi:predicted nucleic acid-binding protein